MQYKFLYLTIFLTNVLSIKHKPDPSDAESFVMNTETERSRSEISEEGLDLAILSEMIKQYKNQLHDKDLKQDKNNRMEIVNEPEELKKLEEIKERPRIHDKNRSIFLDQNSTDSTVKSNKAEMNYSPAINQNQPLYIRFLGWPRALSSQTANSVLDGKTAEQLPITTLLGTDGSKTSGTQILYEKFASEVKEGEKAPLVSVLLLDDNRATNDKIVKVLFEDGFDMLAQKCSCYWVDALELKASVKDLKTSDKYFLQMVDTTNSPPQFNSRSGYFSIQL